MKNNENTHQDRSNRILGELLLLTAFVGTLTWIAWMKLYFKLGIFHSFKLLIIGSHLVVRPFYLMCLIAAFFACALLFSYRYGNPSKKDEHHRGSKLND